MRSTSNEYKIKKKKISKQFLESLYNLLLEESLVAWQGSGGSGGDSAFEWGGGEVLVAA